jgi:NADPH:quinone reductase-like Zn-dependent oxidoreductase
MPQTRTLYRRTGPYPKRLTPLTEPIALTRATDVLIKVHAVSLNYRDINILRGTNPWGVKDDGIPASDAAGEVVGVGEEVEGFEVVFVLFSLA